MNEKFIPRGSENVFPHKLLLEKFGLVHTKAPRLQGFVASEESPCPGNVVDQAGYFFASIGDLAASVPVVNVSLESLFDHCVRSRSRLECLKAQFWFLNPDTVTYARTYLGLLPGMDASGWTALRSVVESIQMRYYPFLAATYEEVQAQPGVEREGMAALCRFQQMLAHAGLDTLTTAEARFYHDAIYFLFTSNVQQNHLLLDVLLTLLPATPCAKGFLDTLMLVAEIQPVASQELFCALNVLQHLPRPCRDLEHAPQTVLPHCEHTLHTPTLMQFCAHPELVKKVQALQLQTQEIRTHQVKVKSAGATSRNEGTGVRRVRRLSQLSTGCVCQLGINATQHRILVPPPGATRP